MWRTGFGLFLFFLGIQVSAHDILRITSVTDRNGLSQNTVRCMMQDSKGFIWMGTINGLNRYNGKEFAVVPSQADSAQALPDSRIRGIIEDGNGYIWVRTFSNMIFCYDPRLETFIDVAPENEYLIFENIRMTSNGDIWMWGARGCCRVRSGNGKLQSWIPLNSAVSFVLEDSENRIWIGGDDELFRISGDTAVSVLKGTSFFNMHEYEGRLFFLANHHVAVFDNQQHSFVSDIYFTRDRSISNSRSCMLHNGLIMIATREDIYALDVKKMALVPAHQFFRGNRPRNASFLTDNKGNVWIYNMSGILWRYWPDHTFEPLRLIPPGVLSLISQERYAVHHDSRGIIWITTFGNGLFAIDQKNGQTYHYTRGNDLATNYLFCILEDRSGGMWVGTEFAGAARITLPNYPFYVFYPTPHGNNDRDNAVRLIYEDSDRQYWFGTRDGNIHVCDSLFRQTRLYGVKDGLPFTMAEDTSGNKWVGTKGAGILVFPSKGNGNPQTYRLNDLDMQASSSNNVFTIMRDTKKRMWVSTFGGGLHLAERTGNQLVFRQIYLQSQHQNMMRDMIQDRTGWIWAGCNDGVIVFDPDEIIRDERKYVNLHPGGRNKLSLGCSEVRAVFEDSRGQIWLGTNGSGLYRVVRENPVEHSLFKRYDDRNGLSNGMIQAIREDNEGHIWVSTESGISKFDPETERFENFIFSNDPQATMFNEVSCWKRKNGELMFGSYNGVLIFDPEKINYDTYAPPVVMTGLWINGNSTNPGSPDSPLTESITSARKIVLKHHQNSINLEFTMLNYVAPELNQYVYYLEGYEKDWNQILRNNIASYRNVPPGSYTFKVKGCNSFGVWSDRETSLQIIIHPPWWKSGWAIFLYIVVLLAIIYFATRLVIKMNTLNMAMEVERQLTEYKLRFFTDISHEFRTPLTIIRGSIEHLSDQKDIPSSIGKHLNILTKSSARLLRLIDQLLEFRRLQNNKMELNLEPVEAKGFFYDIYLTFNELAVKKHIDYLFESNEPEYKMLLDKGKMDKIAYNLLSNAFKNTPVGGTIMMSLDFSVACDTFTLSISDSGAGIPVEKQDQLFERFRQISYTSDGTGIGLHLTSELVKVHKGSVNYKDSGLGGACFVVSVPLSDKNYDQTDIVHDQTAGKVASTIEIATDTESLDETFETSVEKPFKDYKVVVVEDDDEVRAFLESQLDRYFTVSVASNGVEGLEKVASEQPGIVVCDVMMPEMNGYEFTKRLKDNFETSHIPVIMLTAYSSGEHQLKGIQSGADSYITKPFSVKYLLTRIVKLIEQRERLQNKFATEPGLIRSSIGFTGRDKAFLDKIHDTIEENMGNEEFKMESFAQAFNMSRTTFFRKVKGVTGYPPNEYLRIVRMKKAAELLMDTDLNVSEISYRVGIRDPLYLSKCFKVQFGKSPSQYRNQE